MTLAILCSGQGLQHSRMFSLTSGAPAAEPVFAHAAKLLGGCDPRDLIQAEPAEILHRNRVAQIICVSQALAAAAALRNVWPNQILLAGYSVGEVAAWGIAHLLDEAATLDLVAVRAELMDAAGAPGDGLLSIRGLSRSAVEELCKRHSAEIAIVNPNDAFVLGGSGAALDALAIEAMRVGTAAVARIAVNVAAHTARLASASLKFQAALERTPAIKMRTGVRLFSGVDGTAVLDLASGKSKLAEQICRTVQWEACLEGCVEAGASAFLEFGPGAALSKMCARAFPDIPSRHLEDFRTIEGAASWLKRFGSGVRDNVV